MRDPRLKPKPKKVKATPIPPPTSTKTSKKRLRSTTALKIRAEIAKEPAEIDRIRVTPNTKSKNRKPKNTKTPTPTFSPDTVHKQAVTASNSKLTAYSLNKEVSKRIRSVPIPWEIDWETRQATYHDLELFSTTYLPNLFYSEFGDYHREIIKDNERIILDGGNAARGAPRGGGKTALYRSTLLWGTLHGHIRFPFFIASKQDKAIQTLRYLRMNLAENKLLRRDFPEICEPIYNLQNNHARGAQQLYNDMLTYVKIGSQEIHYPNCILTEEEASQFPPEILVDLKGQGYPGLYLTKSAGCIIRTEGIDGSIRGEAETHPYTLEQPRPDFVLLDDVQKDQKADSVIMIQKLVDLIDGAISGLGSHDKPLSVAMICTVTKEGDVSDQYLDPSKKPIYNGKRYRLVETWPDGLTDDSIDPTSLPGELWTQYIDIYKEEKGQDGTYFKALDFYENGETEVVVDEEGQYTKLEGEEDDNISGINQSVEGNEPVRQGRESVGNDTGQATGTNKGQDDDNQRPVDNEPSNQEQGGIPDRRPTSSQRRDDGRRTTTLQKGVREDDGEQDNQPTTGDDLHDTTTQTGEPAQADPDSLGSGNDVPDLQPGSTSTSNRPPQYTKETTLRKERRLVRNRDIMDSGFACSWSERIQRPKREGACGDISPQQTAINLRIGNPTTFQAEYQNRPVSRLAEAGFMVSIGYLKEHTTNIPEGHIAPSWTNLVAFIDPSDEALYYMVVAVDHNYQGQIVDYGTFPPLGSVKLGGANNFVLKKLSTRMWFTRTQMRNWKLLSRAYLADPHNELSVAKFRQELVGPEGKPFKHNSKKPLAPFEGKMYWSIQKCLNWLFEKQYVILGTDPTEKVQTRQIQKIAIDANWGEASDTIKRAAREYNDTRVFCYHGIRVKASGLQMEGWSKKGRVFEHHKHPHVKEVKWVQSWYNDGGNYLTADVDRLKTFAMKRLAEPQGAAGSITLYGNPHPEHHALIAQHIAGSEYPEPMNFNGYEKDEWKEREDWNANDFLDCFVGCLAVASYEGSSLKPPDLQEYSEASKLDGNQRHNPFAARKPIPTSPQKKKQNLSSIWEDKKAMRGDKQ